MGSSKKYIRNDSCDTINTQIITVAPVMIFVSSNSFTFKLQEVNMINLIYIMTTVIDHISIVNELENCISDLQIHRVRKIRTFNIVIKSPAHLLIRNVKVVHRLREIKLYVM